MRDSAMRTVIVPALQHLDWWNLISKKIESKSEGKFCLIEKICENVLNSSHADF